MNTIRKVLSNPKHIIFDLFEVQITGLRAVGEPLGRLVGLSRVDTLRSIWGNGGELQAFFRGKMSEEDCLRNIIHRNRWSVSVAEFKKLIRENFVEVSGTESLIERLKSRGYKLSILSVQSKEWDTHVSKNFGFKKHFDMQSYSYEEGVTKPDVEAFRNHLRKIHSEPGDCLFIDDSVGNTKIADDVGMSTINFRHAEHLEF